jgi:signal transduction histidine kinase
MCPQGGHGALV